MVEKIKLMYIYSTECCNFECKITALDGGTFIFNI